MTKSTATVTDNQTTIGGTSGSLLPPSVVSIPSVNAAPSAVAVGIAKQVYVSVDSNDGVIRQVGIETLGEEGRKIKSKYGGISMGGLGTATVSKVLDTLLRPNDWQPPRMVVDEYGVSVPGRFFLAQEDVVKLCSRVLDIIKNQPMVLHVRAPIKVFGDLHGQFPDLMRMFAKYGAPMDDGDIETTDYLFLGDFVDRGSFSIETVVLLFALKCQYPNQIHLIRGNHEDVTINGLYGFKDECRRRFQEDPDSQNSVYSMMNLIFEWLPCGAVIDGKILCIHGGIGGSIESVADIESIQRPLRVSQTPVTVLEQKVTDLLWSDPTDSDMQSGVTLNETRDPDGSGRIVKFGPDRVEKFLSSNPPLQLIIRAHECVMDGFERFANGKLITVFSATDYCGHHKNAGALLFVRRDMTVVPKLIYPSQQVMSAVEVGSWDTRSIQLRPPTPPRSLSAAAKYPLNPINSQNFAHSNQKRIAD
jgi:protein phosphatase